MRARRPRPLGAQALGAERIDQVLAMEAPDQADVDSDSDTSEVLRFSFHTQLIGSVTQVTSPTGGVVESYEYDPYGKPTIKDQGGSTISASSIGNGYLFTARQIDEETGLYYYRARVYSPELRRFIQRDPLEYVDGPNAVAYVRAQPMRSSDPTGLNVPGYELPVVATGATRGSTNGWYAGEYGRASTRARQAHEAWEQARRALMDELNSTSPRGDVTGPLIQEMERLLAEWLREIARAAAARTLAGEELVRDRAWDEAARRTTTPSSADDRRWY